jgi:hypothetical protein
LKSEFKTYLFKYFHDGKWWMVEIPATSQDDAQERINKLPLAQPLGECFAKIPARIGWMAKLACVVRNFFAARQAA